MKSLLELLYLLLFLYLGSVTYILFSLIFYHQKRFLIIKNIIFFLLIGILWIYISNKYCINYNYFYFISFIIGTILSKYFFEESLIKFNKLISYFLIEFNYYIKLLIIPPIIYKIKCYRYNRLILKKYPYLKKRNKDLF